METKNKKNTKVDKLTASNSKANSEKKQENDYVKSLIDMYYGFFMKPSTKQNK